MTFGAPAVTGRVPFLDASRRSRSCEVVVRSGSAHLAGIRGHLAQPAPQHGGRLLGRVCPVGPFSIVPRILAGGCLAPPSGRRRDGKAHSACWASRKGAVCTQHLTERRSLSPPLPQSASFREIVPPECAFPYGTGCRMRFSVECAFPHLGKRRVASRKSAFCALGLTEKRSLYVGPHGKVQFAPSTSRKGAVCTRAVAQSASFREVRPQAEVRGPRRNPPRSLAGGCSGAFAQLGLFP